MKNKEKKDWQSIKDQVAKQLQDGAPLTGDNGVFTPLIKEVVETALEGELEAHLGETRSEQGNRRNGHNPKNLKSSFGAFEILSPRDRDGSFSPQTIGKRQRNLPGDIDEKVLGLYGLGMIYADIKSHLREMYGLQISDGTLNTITDHVIPAIKEWQKSTLAGGLSHCLDGCDPLQGTRRR